MSLPPPRRMLIVVVCLFVNNFAGKKTSEQICMKFSEKVRNGPVDKCSNSGGDEDHHLDTGIVFWIRYYWRIRKVVNGHSFILIRQMAALVRRALAEVCTSTSTISDLRAPKS